MFMFTGLIARASTEDEVAGVLGHEIGHVNAHHVTRLQAAGSMWSVASLLGMLLAAVNPVLAAGAIAAAQTAQLKYSRDFEQEADYLGLATTTKAGYDPKSLSVVLQAAADRAARESRRACRPTCCRTPSPRIASPMPRA